MNKKMLDLITQIDTMRAQMRSMLDEGKVEDAKAMTGKLKELEDRLSVEAALFEDEKNAVPVGGNPTASASPDGFAIMCKVARKEPLTDAEAALITGGNDGEDYAIPEDVRTEIIKLKRKYKSAVEICTKIPTRSIKGSFNFESGGQPTALTNFTDGSTLTDSDQPAIVPVSFSCDEWGNIIGISNRLIETERAHIMSMIDRWFAKKAILTENLKIFAELKKDKTAVPINDVDDLIDVINLDLDMEIAEEDAFIVTNQHGFNWMAKQRDKTGNSYIQRDLTEPAIKRFDGLTVKVFPTRQLPNITTVGEETTTVEAPVFIGDTAAGVYFVEREGFSMATSDDALFKQNQKALRVIEDFDVVGADKNAYVYALIKISETSGE